MNTNRKKGTFVVKVEDCQKGTWQGNVVWADGETSEHFRSALELIQLVDSALNAAVQNQQSLKRPTG